MVVRKLESGVDIRLHIGNARTSLFLRISRKYSTLMELEARNNEQRIVNTLTSNSTIDQYKKGRKGEYEGVHDS